MTSCSVFKIYRQFSDTSIHVYQAVRPHTWWLSVLHSHHQDNLLSRILAGPLSFHATKRIYPLVLK